MVKNQTKESPSTPGKGLKKNELMDQVELLSMEIRSYKKVNEAQAMKLNICNQKLNQISLWVPKRLFVTDLFKNHAALQQIRKTLSL